MTPEEILARFFASEQTDDDLDEATQALADYAVGQGMSDDDAKEWALAQMVEGEKARSPGFEQMKEAYEGFLEEERRNLTGKGTGKKTDKDAKEKAGRRFWEAYGTTWEGVLATEEKRLSEEKATETERKKAEKEQKALLTQRKAKILNAYKSGSATYEQTARILRETYQSEGNTQEEAAFLAGRDLDKVAPSLKEVYAPFGGPEMEEPPEAGPPWDYAQAVVQRFKEGKTGRNEAHADLQEVFLKRGVASAQEASQMAIDALEKAAPTGPAQRGPFSPPPGAPFNLPRTPGQVPFDPGAWPTQPGQTPAQSAPSNPFLDTPFAPPLSPESVAASFLSKNGRRLTPQEARQKFVDTGNLFSTFRQTSPPIETERFMRSVRDNPLAFDIFQEAFMPTISSPYRSAVQRMAQRRFDLSQAETPDLPFMQYLAQRGGTLF